MNPTVPLIGFDAFLEVVIRYMLRHPTPCCNYQVPSIGQCFSISGGCVSVHVLCIYNIFLREATTIMSLCQALPAVIPHALL